MVGCPFCSTRQNQAQGASVIPLHDQQSLLVSGALRNRLLEICSESGADVNQFAQALVDALQITLIMVGPDADTAARNIRRIADDMLASIHKSYAEYHEMLEARRNTRQ
jgi:hypothetical protein